MVKLAGRSIAIFGAAALVVSVACSFLLDALIVDIGAIIYMLLGFHVLRGSRKAAKWAVAFSVYYTVIGLAIAVISCVSPGLLRVGGKPMAPNASAWALVLLLLASV
jgi:hypothetical protein